MLWPVIALVSLMIFWYGLLVLLTRWPRSLNKSVSQHSASSTESFRFFTAIQAPVGIVLFFFMMLWFVPHFSLPIGFALLYGVSAWLQILSSFIPDTGTGLKSLIHLWMADGFAVGLYACIIWLCLSAQFSNAARIVFVIVLILMTFVALRIMGRGGKPQDIPDYLPLQVTGIVTFQFAIAFAAFFG